MSLEKELRVYDARRDELLAHAGEHVVIAGDDIIGFYHSYEDALNAGYEKVGVKPFLVKKIESGEKALFFTRDINSCRT